MKLKNKVGHNEEKKIYLTPFRAICFKCERVKHEWALGREKESRKEPIRSRLID